MMMAVELSVELDRSAPEPLYQQLADQLRAAIRDGRLQPGDPFENEVALATRLGLSRPTVRRAIHELVSQGLLLRRRGSGTTVANRQIHRKAELSSLHDDLLRAGEAPTTRVLQLEPGTDEEVAAALDLPPDAELVHLRRLRLTGEQPFALMSNWLPAATMRDVDESRLAEHGLYEVLRERGVVPVVAHQTIGARRPSAAERRLLGLGPADPVLTMRRAAFDARGLPVELGDHIYRADSYTIDVTIDDR